MKNNSKNIELESKNFNPLYDIPPTTKQEASVLEKISLLNNHPKNPSKIFKQDLKRPISRPVQKPNMMSYTLPKLDFEDIDIDECDYSTSGTDQLSAFEPQIIPEEIKGSNKKISPLFIEFLSLEERISSLFKEPNLKRIHQTKVKDEAVRRIFA